MSNEVYPALPGLAFGVRRNVIAPPVTIKTTPSQREYRARDATLPRYRYTIVYEFLRSDATFAELQAIVGFFNRHGGSFDDFRFTDPDDNAVTANAFGVGNGSNKVFQILRTFGNFSEPVRDLNGAPLIYVNGALRTLGTHYSISATGLVTFVTAPGAGQPVTWTGSFYRRVRFARDEAEFTKFMQDLWDAKQVELLSTQP